MTLVYIFAFKLGVCYATSDFCAEPDSVFRFFPSHLSVGRGSPVFSNILSYNYDAYFSYNVDEGLSEKKHDDDFNMRLRLITFW